MAEAYLLVMATPCEACGKGPLEALDHEGVELQGAPGRRLRARCGNCGHEQAFLLSLRDIGAAQEAQRAAGLPVINPTEERSRVIDLAQWLMLFEGIVRSADRQSNPAEARRLGYEAAQCLEEALKFYPSGSAEWPDESAFYHDWTLRRYREHQHLFARTRLVQLRGRLPTLSRMQQRLTSPPRSGGRPWWAFWRR